METVIVSECGRAKAISKASFRGDAKHRTRNLEIPGLVLTHHPGMTEKWIASPLALPCANALSLSQAMTAGRLRNSHLSRGLRVQSEPGAHPRVRIAVVSDVTQ